MSNLKVALPIRPSQPTNPTTLSIGGRDLINAIVDEKRSKHLPIALENVNQLTVLNLNDWRVNDNTFDKFFQLLRSLRKLQDLTVTGFAIPPFERRLATPNVVFLFPLTIAKVTLVNTSGDSLKLMLNCVQATEVVLQSCKYIQALPHCETLRLVGIEEWGREARRELLSVFEAWDGRHLIVEASPFFDDVFVLLLGARMRLNGRAMWRSARDLAMLECPATWTEVNEMWKVRERFILEERAPPGLA